MKVAHDKRTGAWDTFVEGDHQYSNDLIEDQLKQVFLNGELTRDENLDTIRKRVNRGLVESQKSFKAALA